MQQLSTGPKAPLRESSGQTVDDSEQSCHPWLGTDLKLGAPPGGLALRLGAAHRAEQKCKRRAVNRQAEAHANSVAPPPLHTHKASPHP